MHICDTRSLVSRNLESEPSCGMKAYFLLSLNYHISLPLSSFDLIAEKFVWNDTVIVFLLDTVKKVSP